MQDKASPQLQIKDFGLSSVQRLCLAAFCTQSSDHENKLLAQGGGLDFALLLYCLFIAENNSYLGADPEEVLQIFQQAMEEDALAKLPQNLRALAKAAESFPQYIQQQAYLKSRLIEQLSSENLLKAQEPLNQGFAGPGSASEMPLGPLLVLCAIPQFGGAFFFLKHSYHLQRLLMRYLCALTEERPCKKKALSAEQLKKALKSFAGVLKQDEKLLANCLETLARQQLFLLNGGPGSGKTTLLVSLLRILSRSQEASNEKLQIVLASPTGRAAQRMLESIQRELHSHIDYQQNSSENHYLPQDAQTLHKLLQRAAQKPLLFCDIIVIDEASMLSSEMALQVLQKLDTKTKLILIGDPEQLPPVGSSPFWQIVLEDINDPAQLLHKSQVRLHSSHRSKGEIQALAQLVLNSKSEALQQQLEAASSPQKQPQTLPQMSPLRMQALPSPQELAQLIWQDFGIREALEKHRPFSSAPEQWQRFGKQLDYLFANIHNFTVLSPMNIGPYGSTSLNKLISRQHQAAKQQGIWLGDSWYGHLSPIQIRQNNYRLQLFNGDRGLVLQFRDRFYAFFPQASLDPLQRYHFYPLQQLDNYSSSYVQTIHKSQGSEFDSVYILLPEAGAKLWSKKLLYTAITRAKSSIVFFGEPAQCIQILQQDPVHKSLVGLYLQGKISSQIA